MIKNVKTTKSEGNSISIQICIFNSKNGSCFTLISWSIFIRIYAIQKWCPKKKIQNTHTVPPIYDIFLSQFSSLLKGEGGGTTTTYY